MRGRVLMAKDMIFGSFLFVWFLWSVRAIMATQEDKMKNRKASDFNWTDNEIQLLRSMLRFQSRKWLWGSELGIKTHEVWTDKVKVQYPEVEDEKFSRSNDLDSITKVRVLAKLKSNRTNF